MFNKYSCDEVVFIGDVIDLHAISFHAKHPECPGPMDEYELALETVSLWYENFPKATVTIGNHDNRVVRLASTVGIPAYFVKDYSDLWLTPGWTWTYDTIIDDVYYVHGEGKSGKDPAASMANSLGMSVVMGHAHSVAGKTWLNNPKKRYFGLNTGCGIDREKFQFAYGKHMTKKPMLAVGVVLDGTEAYSEAMPLGPGEQYAK